LTPHPRRRREWIFLAAIAATHRIGCLKPPTALCNMPDEAIVTIECAAQAHLGRPGADRPIVRRGPAAEALLTRRKRRIRIVKS
jgi:hypothetical protein